MIEGLKPYAEYKESGLPWLSKIPSNWQTVRNGSLFSQRNETNYPHLPIREVSLRTGVRVRNFETSNRKQLMSDFSKYKRAMSEDIAYNMMRMWQGAVGVVPVDGLVSPAYVVARPFPNTNVHYFRTQFRMDLYLGEIDGFIRAKRKLIGLLNEQKQAIIHHAVTRGLDPNVPLKPSNIPWLGDIPKHWEMRRLRHACEMRLSNVDKHTIPGETPVWLTGFGKVTPLRQQQLNGLSDARGSISPLLSLVEKINHEDWKYLFFLCVFVVKIPVHAPGTGYGSKVKKDILRFMVQSK